ncbi:hypothetical protein V6N13_058618 [Hibiscus sabdariffa]|uniref:Uncharacterized protein n=1 Tax=Hibiscus sabdariffa TaxID=183260 RepID=A0ABR2GFM8_9ROSI
MHTNPTKSIVNVAAQSSQQTDSTGDVVPYSTSRIQSRMKADQRKSRLMEEKVNHAYGGITIRLHMHQISFSCKIKIVWIFTRSLHSHKDKFLSQMRLTLKARPVMVGIYKVDLES